MKKRGKGGEVRAPASLKTPYPTHLPYPPLPTTPNRHRSSSVTGHVGAVSLGYLSPLVSLLCRPLETHPGLAFPNWDRFACPIFTFLGRICGFSGIGERKHFFRDSSGIGFQLGLGRSGPGRGTWGALFRVVPRPEPVSLPCLVRAMPLGEGAGAQLPVNTVGFVSYMKACKCMNIGHKMITQERLKELVRYDPDTGEMVLLQDVGKRKIGDTLGSINTNGYVVGYLDGRLYPVHRLAFLYMTGDWPKELVDHKNGTRSDNRWGNIRPASHQQNMQNRRCSVLSASGYKGVRKSKHGWSASIMKDGKSYRLGIYATPELAHAAYKGAAIVLFGEFASPG